MKRIQAITFQNILFLISALLYEQGFSGETECPVVIVDGSSGFSVPEAHDATTRYFNADMINQCTGGSEGGAEGGNNNLESGTAGPDVETASPADGPEVNYTQVSLEVLSDIAQAGTSGLWGQFAADIDPDNLKKLNAQERLLHAFSHSVNRQFPNLVSVAPIPGMLGALSELLEQSPELSQNILAASVRAFGAVVQGNELDEQKIQVAPGLLSKCVASIKNVLAASVRAFGAVVQRSELHGKKIQVAPDLLSKFVANPAAITVIPKSILKRLEPHMRYYLKNPVDIPEGSSNNDIALPAAGGYMNSLPSGCYSFKHHPINFIIPERQGEGSDYLIYLAGSHLFLKTKSKDAVENFVKIAVESWHTEYKSIIQYNPVCDLDAIELGPRLGEGSVPDKKSKYKGCITREQDAPKESYKEGTLLVGFDNFANIKEMDKKIRSLPDVIGLGCCYYMGSDYRMHVYKIEQGQEKKLVPLMYDIDGVYFVELNRIMKLADIR